MNKILFFLHAPPNKNKIMVKQKIKKSQSFVKYILFLTLCKEDTTNVNTYFSVFSTSYILCGQNIILLKAQKVKENGKF